MTKKFFFIAVLSLVVLQFVLIFPEKIGICSLIKSSECNRGFINSIYRDPLYILSISVLLMSITTFFISNTVFNVWKKFTYFCIPLFLILVLLTPETTGNMLFDMDKEFVSMVLSGLYIIISLLLIIIMSIVTHLKSQKKL